MLCAPFVEAMLRPAALDEVASLEDLEGFEDAPGVPRECAKSRAFRLRFSEPGDVLLLMASMPPNCDIVSPDVSRPPRQQHTARGRLYHPRGAGGGGGDG